MPAQYVKPYMKRRKNDAADAEAICEAATRPTMRFVAVKTPEQSVMMLHRVRLMLNRQRTQLSNAMRTHMSEFGVAALQTPLRHLNRPNGALIRAKVFWRPICIKFLFL
jgi:transposase